MNELIVLGLGGFVLYLMVFDTDRFNKANEAGWRNVERTGKVVGHATRFGLGAVRLFRRW